MYKEERDIVEPPAVSYAEVRSALDDKRRLFRELNRALRVVVEFKDER